jgi:oligopeptide/dipeptide ABC transporter ATP-binding protein
MSNLLEVDNLTVQFRGDSGWITAVDDVSLNLREGETLGIVGESGSGKSVTALSILRLHTASTTRHPTGRIVYAGKDMLALTPPQLRAVRGREIAMIFQDPMSSLNPVLTIADQIGETLRLHQGLDAAASRQRAIELLELVRIPDARRRIDEYPHRLSGGMRQRVMIAIAIACRPRLLIADEPTTALDVTIQAQSLDLLRELQSCLGMSVILISHDMGVIAEFAQRVVVMYAGRIVETAPVKDLFRKPFHPYTEGLLAAIPKLDVDVARLPTIRGSIPDPAQLIQGCRYSPRCLVAVPQCRIESPALLPAGPSRYARCPPRVAASRVAAP